MKLAVLYHMFYEDTAQFVAEELKHIPRRETTFLFNISVDMPGQREACLHLQRCFPGSYVSVSSNVGKDIGAKLLLMAACLKMNIKPEWLLVLHDKKSHQAFAGSSWKKSLLKITSPSVVSQIGDVALDERVGIFAASEFVKNEILDDEQANSNNSKILKALCEKYTLTPLEAAYVAGTMYWVKWKPYFNFFSKVDPLSIRSGLEEGNVIDNFKGTQTHSWERLFSWIVTSQGYKIKQV